jgi:hypothetical protein
MMLTDRDLDGYRHRADDALDGLVSSHGPRVVGEMLSALFRSKDVPDDDRFRALTDRLPPIAVADAASIAAGQQLFHTFGPEALVVLGCYALPAAYAASDGVQVVYRARRLKDDAQRRLSETAQMVLNVMVPGGLEPGGIGARSARKVRLMHALVRQHVRTLAEPAWSPALGEPINQEDLVGTLLTFSLVVIDGLRKMGAQLSQASERGYFAVWCHIGAILGIEAPLLPRDIDMARALAAQIGRRQFRPSDEGRHLARELLKVNDSLFPIPGYGLSLMHFFLDGGVFGVHLAKVLDLPPANWTRFLVRLRAAQKGIYFQALARVPGAERRRAAFASFFTQQLISLQSPDKVSPFEVPPGLLETWRLHETAPAWWRARSLPTTRSRASRNQPERASDDS